MFKDFKEFALRGNMMDLAVGVIIGAAFGKIITSITNDLIMPVISLITGRIDFNNLFVTLAGPHMSTLAEAQSAQAVTLNYGSFITNVVDFILIALVVFLLVRALNRFRKPVPVTTKSCPRCMMPINKDATRCPHCTTEL